MVQIANSKWPIVHIMRTIFEDVVIDNDRPETGRYTTRWRGITRRNAYPSAVLVLDIRERDPQLSTDIHDSIPSHLKGMSLTELLVE